MFFQVILEFFIVIIAVCGLVLHSGLVSGEIRRDFFRYYTNLSNLLVAMFYLIRIVVRITKNFDGFFGKIVFSELWFYSVTMSIFLTFGIYHFVLFPYIKKAPEGSDEFRLSHSFSNYCVHYIVPLLSVLNWLIFANKTELEYSWALIWIVIPWCYVVYTFIRASDGVPLEHTTSAYPYEFMDLQKNGWLKTIRNCLIVTVVFVSAGFLLIFIRKMI